MPRGGRNFIVVSRYEVLAIFSLDNFLHIGRILKACAQNEEMIEPLLDRLVVHADVVIGPLPPGHTTARARVRFN